MNRSSDFHHFDLHKPRVEKEEKVVSSVVEVLESWINPFDESQELVSISTATAAPQDVTNDLMHACETRDTAYQAFIKERLE